MTTDRRRTRHVARSARILSTGVSTAAILGITAAFGAAERAQSATNQDSTTTLDTAVSFPAPPPTTSGPTAQLPSPVGNIALPASVAETRVTVAAAPQTAVAPISAAEPPVHLTLPPPPSNGSSGGSH